MTKSEKAAQTVITKCLELQKDESVLVLASEQMMEIAEPLHRACLRKTKNSFLLKLGKFGNSPILHDSIGTLMKNVDVVLAVTSPSISHTPFRRKASLNGTRIASLPNITLDTFCRLNSVNYEKTARLAGKLSDILTMAKEIKLTAPNGTDLTIPIGERKGVADTGLLTWPGAFSNLPAGEAYISPDDDGTQGVLVVDSGMFIGVDEREQLRLQIKDGKAVRISGGLAARRLRQHLGKFGPVSRLVAEFGIGTNDALRISGHELEDEKMLGTAHIGIGNNISFGGANDIPVHLDAVIYKASVLIDGKQILDQGKLVL